MKVIMYVSRPHCYQNLEKICADIPMYTARKNEMVIFTIDACIHLKSSHDDHFLHFSPHFTSHLVVFLEDDEQIHSFVENQDEEFFENILL